MEKVYFKIDINAPKAKIWAILWNEDTYPIWTAPFSAGSKAITDWKKDSKILFLNNDGKGMIAKVDDHIPEEFMSILHLGLYKDGEKDFTSDKVREWENAYEKYKLSTKDGQSFLTVEVDTTLAFMPFFEEKFPEALNLLKKLAEN